MNQWQPIDSAPMDGTPIRVLYADKIEGASRWLTSETGQRGSRSRLHRAQLISKFGGYWSNARKTRPSRSRPTHWQPLEQPPDKAVMVAPDAA